MGKTQKRRREHESDSDSDSSECSYLVESKKDESDDERDKSSKDDDDGNSDEPSDEAEEGLSEYEKFRLGKIDRNNQVTLFEFFSFLVRSLLWQLTVRLSGAFSHQILRELGFDPERSDTQVAKFGKGKKGQAHKKKRKQKNDATSAPSSSKLPCHQVPHVCSF